MINACVKDVLSFLRYSMSRLELVVWLPTASPAWEHGRNNRIETRLAGHHRRDGSEIASLQHSTLSLLRPRRI